jgi:hypothetical protein
MMKKNYFGMIVAAAMMFAGFSLTSCSENDVAIIDGEVWVKPEVQLTDDGAIVKGSSPSDISRMISRVKNEISAAAQAGKSFKISVDASVINSTSSDNAISIPTVTNSDIVLSFSNPIQTEVPLVFKSKGAGDDATAQASTNKLEIDIPSGSSKMDMELIFPTSTVTLKGGAINKVTALTAYNTMIIESGVTIEWLKMKGGRAEVKDGGKVNGYLRDGDSAPYGNADAYVYNDGVEPIWGNYGYDVFYMKDDVEMPYYAKNLKIDKGEKSKIARVRFDNGKADEAANMIIADGAAAAVVFYTQWESEDKSYPAKVNSIQGEGNKTAKIYPYSISWWTSDGEKVYYASVDLAKVKKLSNVTVDVTTHPEYGTWDSGDWATEEVKINDGYIYLPQESTDCDFISPLSIYGTVTDGIYSKVTNCNLTCPTEIVKIGNSSYYPYMNTINASNSTLSAREISGIYGNSEGNTFKGRYVSFNNYYITGNDATVKNCKFEVAGDDPRAEKAIPYQTKDRSSFDFIFDNCAFGKGFMFNTYFSGNKPWIDKDGKKVTKAYGWHELEEDGYQPKYDENGNYITKRSTSEDDVPEANKANGKNYGNWSWNGYWEDSNENGVTTDAYYDDYRADITFNSTTIDGKAITKDTEFISNVASGYNEKGEIATTTRFILDGVSYKAVKDSDTQKWILIAVD